MRFFYKPRYGVVGDCIPYFYEGRYHVFYLRDYRDPDSHRFGSPWHHVSTTDFVHFDDHGEALPKGTDNEQDPAVATGSVYTDDSGRHHIFYTGINPGFRTDTQREQAVLHAVSDDLLTWKKVPGEVWYADESRYERHDWRDPFVFRNPDTGRYHMLLAARLAEGPTAGRGCTALLTSDDLTNWAVEDPFYAPGRYHGHECPDLFRIGDWYYLVFSEYTTRTTTRYVMSRSLDGPWTAPKHNHFDNRAFYAAKTAGDDERRFLFGWNPSKVGNTDDGDWQWGGCLTVHEILQNDDGTLAVRMPQQAHHAFGEPASVDLALDGTAWTGSAGVYRADARYARSTAVGTATPESYVLEATITFERDGGEAGLLLNTDTGAHNGYFLRLSTEDQAAQFGKIGGYRSWYLDHMPELDRPLPIRPGQPVTMRVIVDKTAVVAYLNDTVALSGRLYPNTAGRCGLYADGSSVTVAGLSLRPIPGS
ncbi:GH32 C-terminal domain-containing protein [Micromonospora echinospora]|uniref:GH32 C-terminal domain-containing protein n=1 Tax=Micromonospora echinospora TaxID=1877 RepID=UPI0037B7FE85